VALLSGVRTVAAARGGFMTSRRCGRLIGFVQGLLGAALALWSERARGGSCLPLHVWLPIGHHSGASHVSALRSGVHEQGRHIRLHQVVFDAGWRTVVVVSLIVDLKLLASPRARRALCVERHDPEAGLSPINTGENIEHHLIGPSI